MSDIKDATIGIGISVDDQSVEEALEKVEALGEATADLAPMVSLRSLRGCTVNIYVSRNSWTEGDGREVER